MDDETFKGLENELKHLDISNNQLTSLPLALGTLSKLKVLNVSNNFVGNTVLDMTESVMRALGISIPTRYCISYTITDLWTSLNSRDE
jgi:5-enolpyruvylshikimate-3-phosphate synthase